MQLFTKVIIGTFIASFLQWLNYSFFIGFVLGTLAIIIIQYNYIMKYLQEKHKDYEISVTSIQQHVEEFLHPIKVKPKHYINRFNMELQVQNPQPQSDKQWQLQQATVIKLGRKKYLKRIETYQDFLDELKDAQQQHGQLLCNLDSKLQIENELTQLHKFKEENSEVILSLTGVQMTNQMHLLLPQWKDYKKILKFFGHQHIDVAKTINHCVQEQIVTLLKKNYSKEMEEFRKQRRKLKNTTVECYQHYQKILNEYYQHEKELQMLTQTHAEMIKRKDDPASIIKSEMKVKLQIQQQDNIRLKLTDSRDSLKENTQEVKEFNNKLSAALKSYEEQRIVFTKQCFQNSLIGIEDMATKMQTLISSLIIILDEDNCQIFPQRVSKSPILSPQKSFTEIPQNPQLGEMSLNDQIKECQRQTDFLLGQWNLIQKYNEEIEYFFKDLIVIFTPQTQDKDLTTVRKQLESEKTTAGESLNIMVKSLLKGTQIFKDSIKLLIDQFERKRQEIAKCRLDMSIGRELEQRAILDLKKLQGLNSDEKALEQYSSEFVQGSKTKKAAQHFLSEMKQNFKDVSSLNLGKFAATVSQSVSKVTKMSNLKEDDLREQQLKLNEDKKNLISLQGFTLKKLEEILNQHNKLISKMKKQLIDDLGTFSLTLHNHLRMIVDEMTENIQMIQQREKLESQQDEQCENEQQNEVVPTTEEIVEDLHVGTTSLLVQKLFKVFVNDWKESQYFKNKIKKLLEIKLNKKRANMLSQIDLKDLLIVGDPPTLTNIQSLRQDVNEFLCDFDISFRGKVQLQMTTNILINWPKEYQVPVEVKAIISTFTSRIRLCFVPSYLGKSWLSMIGQPVVNLDVEPTLLQKYNIAKIQQIADLIREFLIGKIKLMTYPNKLTIKIPLSKK